MLILLLMLLIIINIIEGSSEAKFPTISTNGKGKAQPARNSGMEKVRREKKRHGEKEEGIKRKNVKKKKIQLRKKVKNKKLHAVVARNTF